MPFFSEPFRGKNVRNVFAAALAAVWLSIAAPASAADLVVVGGKLAGATSVSVGGTLYNVTFEDGSCASVFGSCNASTDFGLTTQAQALLAAQALFDQVWTGNYDTAPDLTNGCTVTTCFAFVLYGASDDVFNASYAINDIYVADLNAPQLTNQYSNLFNSATSQGAASSVIARFQLQSAAVPEPATWAMMLLGFGGIGFSMRRKGRTALQAV